MVSGVLWYCIAFVLPSGAMSARAREREIEPWFERDCSPYMQTYIVIDVCFVVVTMRCLNFCSGSQLLVARKVAIAIAIRGPGIEIEIEFSQQMNGVAIPSLLNCGDRESPHKVGGS